MNGLSRTPDVAVNAAMQLIGPVRAELHSCRCAFPLQVQSVGDPVRLNLCHPVAGVRNGSLKRRLYLKHLSVKPN